MTDKENSGISQTVEQAEAGLQNVLNSIKNGEEPSERETLKLKKEEDFTKEEINEVAKNDFIDSESFEQEPQKTGFVETNDPAVQKRINELYKDSKEAHERNLLLQDELRRLINATESREAEYQKRLFELENRHVQQDEQTALSQLRQEYKEAIENFEYDKASQINEKIIDFKTEQRLNSIQRQSAIKMQKSSPMYGDQAADVAELNVLTAQKDESGQDLRPWLKPAHPRFNDVVNATAIIADRYLKKGQRPSLTQVIQEVESSLNLGRRSSESSHRQPSHPAVLSSNTMAAGISENQGEKLTSEQRIFASKLGISEKEYAKTLRLSKSGPISVKSF